MLSAYQTLHCCPKKVFRVVKTRSLLSKHEEKQDSFKEDRELSHLHQSVN